MKPTGLSLIALIGFLALGGDTDAGPVQFQSGSITIRYQDAVDGSDSASFPVSFPGAATERYDGSPLDPEVPIGDDRGDSGATYDLRDLDDGATFDVSLFHSNNGDEQRTLGGDVVFGFTFTTDRILHYSFTADPTGPSSAFLASFAGVDQDLRLDVFGQASGTLQEDGNPIARTVEGELPAGTHSLELFLEVVNGRNTTGGSGSGAVSISLSERANPPPVIPLPAAVWPGLAMLAGGGMGLRILKRRRR